MKRALALLAPVLLVPAIAFAAPSNLRELVELLVKIFNAAAALMVLAALALFMYSILMNLQSGEATARQNLRTAIMWGILALFVMVSIWGILRIIQSTLFGATGVLPT